MSIFDELIEDEGLRTKVEEIHNSTLTATMDEKISGLSSKNKQLLDEVKKASTKFKTLQDTIGDLDIKSAKEALALINSEEGKLLREGKKLEELVDVKLSSTKADYEARLAEQSALNRDNKAKKNKWRSKFQNKTIDDTIREAALIAKVRPEALQDIITRGRGVFSIADDGVTVEARDNNGDLLKVGDLIANPKNWVDSLKTIAPHYWPGSSGAGFTGDGAGGGSDNHAKMLDAAKRKDMVGYRKYKALWEKENQK